MDLKKYDVIYCDIDDTIILGWFEKVLDISWRLFKSPKLFQILAKIQAKFKLYKENTRFLQMLSSYTGLIVFLTARSKSPATKKILVDIMYKYVDLIQIELHELASYNPTLDKLKYIQLHKVGDGVLFDDNPMIRHSCAKEVDVFDARFI